MPSLPIATFSVTHAGVAERLVSRVKGAVHVQKLDAYHSRFREWIARFYGVATHCPNARVIYDLFHVFAKYGRQVKEWCASMKQIDSKAVCLGARVRWPMHTGQLEGTNNRIKVMKWMANGDRQLLLLPRDRKQPIPIIHEEPFLTGYCSEIATKKIAQSIERGWQVRYSAFVAFNQLSSGPSLFPHEPSTIETPSLS